MRQSRHSLWPIALSFPVGVVGAAAARYALLLPIIYEDFLARHPALNAPFLMAGIAGVVRFTSLMSGACSVVFVAVALLGILARRPWVLAALRTCYVAGYALFLLCAHAVFKATGAILAANVKVDGTVPNPVVLFYWRYEILVLPFVGVVVLAVMHLMSWCRAHIALYTGRLADSPAIGDRILENLRTHGGSPPYRKSVLASVAAHIMVILVLPWLFSFGGCVESYLVPKGSGTAQVMGGAAAPVKIVKAKKKTKKTKKRYVLNPHSAISFHIPDLDESMVEKDVADKTEVTYAADTSRDLSLGVGLGRGGAGGKMGAGGGKGGGWPDGMENAVVRFIRLEYNGPGWDDGMDSISRADMNFLDAFRKLTGFKVASHSESHAIGLLRRYKKGFAPPFLYMTGSGDINVSATDIKALRDYLLDGGLLFADCGSPSWDRSFRTFIQAVLPGEPLREISDDDQIFQMPYVFPNGAPPLWHHGGNRALGAKHKNRWVVFYHPGDINDAWKTGHSGMDPQLANGAIEIGVNVVYYSFTHYLEMTRKYRK